MSRSCVGLVALLTCVLLNCRGGSHPSPADSSTSGLGAVIPNPPESEASVPDTSKRRQATVDLEKLRSILTRLGRAAVWTGPCQVDPGALLAMAAGPKRAESGCGRSSIRSTPRAVESPL